MSASNTSTVTYYSPLEFIGTVTAGTINATSVVTSGTTTYNNLTANSAVATDGSKNLVSVANTGTGNNVLSASPTLTGTVTAAAITASGLVTANLGLTVTGATTSVTTLSASSTVSATQYTSTITTGTAPLVVASTTNVANLNASLLNGSTFAQPSSIGSTTPNTGAFTTLSTSGLLTAGAGLTSTAATNNFGATTMSGAIAMGTNKITGLGYPTANTDAASKLYVDTVSQGLDAKDSVRAATTVNGDLATAYENGDIIDGVTLVTGNRILLKNQTDPIENGIYIVAASGAPTRSSDFAAASTPTGAYTFVEEGTVNISAGFVTTAPAGTNTVGTHAMPFTQFSGAGQITAGTGLTKTGNTLSVNASQTQITSVGTLTALTVSPGTSSMTAGTFSATIDVTGIATLRNTVELVGATTGVISVKTQSASGTYNFNLPTTAGSSSDVLTSAGGAGAPMTWSATNGTGDVVRTTSATLVTPALGAATGTSLQLSGLTASQAVATDASKNLVSVATTGTGNYVLQTSPTLITPTLGAAVGTSLQLSGLTASQAVATDASKNLVSVATTGTGNYVLQTSPTLITPTLGAAVGTSLQLSGLTASQVVVTDGSKNLASLGYSATPTASFIVSYDANKNITANNLIGQSTTTATAAGTTILTVASTLNQVFTGTTTQTIQLPDGTTIPVGWQSNIINQSTQNLTVVDAGSNAVATVYAGKSQQLILSVSSVNGTWALLGSGSVTSVAASVPSFLSISGSPITSSGTLAITYSGTALPITSGGTGSTTATGTGAVVLANTPTLITPVLGAATGTSISLTSTVSATQYTSTISTGTAPFVVASTTNVANLNASSLSGATFAEPGPIGLTTASTGAFTTVSASGLVSANLGLTVAGANTSVTTLSASGLVSANLGLTVTGANTSVTTLSASGLVSANLGLTVTGGGTSVTTMSASGLITAGAGLTSTAATNNFGATTMSGAIAMGTNKITGLGYPTASTDAASKLYVDTVAQGLDAKDSVRVATTANGTLATDFENGDVIDGITLVTGNRILIKNQTSPIENGIYIVAASGAPTRAADFAATSVVTGAFTFVEDGSVNSSAGFVTLGTVTVNSDPLTFVQFSGAGQITAGTGLTKTGNTLSVNASQTQITTVGTLTALTVTGLVSANLGLTVTGANTSVTTLSASGLVSANLGLTVTGANTSVTSLSASDLITANAGLTVATGTTTLSTLTASTALALDGSKGIISVTNTGTGNNVLSVSPTLTGTLTAAAITASALVTANLGLTVTGANTSVTTLSASGLVSANLGLTVTGANTSVTTLSASGLVTTNAGIALTGDLTMAGSSSGIVSIKTQAAAGTFNFNLPVTAGSTGQVLTSAGGAGAPMTWKTVLSSSQSSFGGVASASNANVTGLVFTGGSFETNVIVDVVATTNLSQVFKLSGLLSGGASGWNLTAVGISGDATGVTFSITSGGQIRYSSTAYAGFVSLTITWTDYINASGLLNLTSGVNVSKVISGTDGPLFNVSGATVTDNGTANSGTLALFSANYIGRPTIAATGTSVTTTQANTVFIAGEPIAGTNETITNKHALKIGAGGKIGMDGSSSGTVSITTQAAAGTFNFNLPVTAGSSGQVLASAGGSSSPMTWVNVTTAAIAAGSFSGANNQSSPANITGLVFSSGYFKIDVIVTVVATTNLTEYFVIYGVLSNNTGTGWALTSTSVAGDTTGAAITINSSGQLLYTSANHAGFTSITFAWA